LSLHVHDEGDSTIQRGVVGTITFLDPNAEQRQQSRAASTPVPGPPSTRKAPRRRGSAAP
jgi:hypothetical protein